MPPIYSPAGLFRAGQVMLILLLLVSGLGGAPAPVDAQGPIPLWPEGWSDLEPLYPISIYSAWIALQSDPEDQLALVWSSGTFQWELDMLYAEVEPLPDGGVAMGSPQVISAEPGFHTRPAMAVAEDGTRHGVWQRRHRDKYELRYTRLDATGNITLADQPLTGSHRVVQQPAIVLDDAQRLHVFWSDFRGTRHQIYHGVVDDTGEWHIPPHALTDSASISVAPAVVRSEDGTLHVVWLERQEADLARGEGDGLFYMALDTDGRPLREAIRIGPVVAEEERPVTLAAGPGDSVHVVWSVPGDRPGTVELYHTRVGPEGFHDQPTSLIRGSGRSLRPRLVWNQPQAVFDLVWMDTRDDVSQVHYARLSAAGELLETQRLGVDWQASLTPDITIDTVGNRWVTWLAPDPASRTYRLSLLQTQDPKPLSVWRGMGLDEDSPVMNALMVTVVAAGWALVYLFLNVGVWAAALVGLAILNAVRILPGYRPHNLSYMLLGFALLFLLHDAPVIGWHPEAYGLAYTLFSAGAAAVVTIIFVRLVRPGNGRDWVGTAVVMGLWLYWYLFLGLIPETMYTLAAR